MSHVDNNPSKSVLGVPRIKITVGESRVEREVFIAIVFNQSIFPVENPNPDRDPLFDVKANGAPIAIIALPGISWKDKLHGLYPPAIDHSLRPAPVFEFPPP
jgi:hypothetical protein